MATQIGRRRFVGASICAAAIRTAAGAGWPVRQITPHATVIEGPVNGVLLSRDGKTLAVYGDPRGNPPPVERVLFTHHRRDVAWAGHALAQRGAIAVVPAAEKPLFTDVNRYWQSYPQSRFRDLSMQTSRILAEPFQHVETVRGGDRVAWQDTQIEVVDSRGYTRGAVSYVFTIDGTRIACTGDLIYGDGRILDLYSLQDEIPEAKEDAYHGYAARAADVIGSLRMIAARKPDLLIPARGPVIRDPQAAIDRLTARLRAVLASHFAIDALRWYRGDESMRIQARRVLGDTPPRWMPMAETRHDRPPDWIVPVLNSRLIVSRSGAGFLIDCGGRQMAEQVKKLIQEGRVKRVEGIYVTHYHSDHTGYVQAAAEEFNCPVYACAAMRRLLEHPEAYHMPVETANAVRKVTGMPEGAKQRWHEFEFTYSHFPGQTFYDGGLLVKKDGGETIFFVGDSFTPTGMDDYCLLNRNLVEPERGYAYCLNVLKRMGSNYLLINEHVLPTFRFSPPQLDLMLDNFRHRADLMRELFPWDDPNYGIDGQWARIDPYTPEAAAGRPLDLAVRILNHSPVERTFRITPHLPAGWTGPRDPLMLSVKPRREGSAPLRVIPPSGDLGVRMITADVAFGPWDLREWAEAAITVK